MKLEDLKINQWYYTPEYKFYYKNLGKDRRVSYEQIMAHYKDIDRDSEFSENSAIANSGFWEDKNLRETNYSEVEKYLPEHLKEKINLEICELF